MAHVRTPVWREVQRQLTSPATWLIVALFAVLAGAAFVIALNGFLERSSQALLTPPPDPVDINQLLIRPFLLHVGLIALLVLPLVTARAHAREPRSDRATIVAVFAGVFAVYAVMLLIALAPVATLFGFGAPEWRPIVSGTLGLVLIGGAFISAALVVSSLATRAWPAGFATLAMSLALAAATWLAQSGTPNAQAVFRYVSVGGALDDFAKGVIDTRYIVSCVSVVAVGLFLALRSEESGR
jgi:ABC-2 type transport system permease protein